MTWALTPDAITRWRPNQRRKRLGQGSVWFNMRPRLLAKAFPVAPIAMRRAIVVPTAEAASASRI
jgi:hypothetical protein